MMIKSSQRKKLREYVKTNEAEFVSLDMNASEIEDELAEILSDNLEDTDKTNKEDKANTDLGFKGLDGESEADQEEIKELKAKIKDLKAKIKGYDDKITTLNNNLESLANCDIYFLDDCNSVKEYDWMP